MRLQGWSRNNFDSDPIVKLICLSKSDKRCICKNIIDKTMLELKIKIGISWWSDTEGLIGWFKKIEKQKAPRYSFRDK